MDGVKPTEARNGNHKCIDRERIPLMLIHGAWLSARSWENFADYFEKRGFAALASRKGNRNG